MEHILENKDEIIFHLYSDVVPFVDDSTPTFEVYVVKHFDDMSTPTSVPLYLLLETATASTSKPPIPLAETHKPLLETLYIRLFWSTLRDVQCYNIALLQVMAKGQINGVKNSNPNS